MMSLRESNHALVECHSRDLITDGSFLLLHSIYTPGASARAGGRLGDGCGQWKRPFEFPILKLLGATVIATASTAEKLAVCRQMGADQCCGSASPTHGVTSTNRQYYPARFSSVAMKA